jgi:multiple sugar transport system substrate-binding protein
MVLHPPTVKAGRPSGPIEETMQAEISINQITDLDEMRLILNDFERLHNARLELQVFDWSNAWAELMKISLYGHGPIVSEVGSTWVSSLAGQNSLRPFKPQEIASMGGKENFLPESWQSCLDLDGENVLAIPWALNTYLVYYRRDLLANAGVDESTAFASIENLNHTLESLRDTGLEMPIALPNCNNSVGVLHNASTFVWEKGGDFILPDGKKVCFSDPNTLAGLREYFNLHKFMRPFARNLYDDDCSRAFLEGGAAVTFRSLDLLSLARGKNVPPQVSENTSIAIQPGIPFVGGSNLVIWNHIPPLQEPLAVDLVRYLTSPENMMTQFLKTKYTPANLEALNRVELDPTYSPLAQSLKKGRAFKRVPLWGLVEDKLVKALNHIWQKIFEAPEPNIDQIIQDTLLPLENRLNITLSP